MKKHIRKDQGFRKCFFNHEKKKFMLSYSTKSLLLLQSVRDNLRDSLLDLPKESILGRCVSRCVITGRRKRLNKLFNFSRLVLLRFFRSRLIVQLKKSKW